MPKLPSGPRALAGLCVLVVLVFGIVAVSCGGDDTDDENGAGDTTESSEGGETAALLEEGLAAQGQGNLELAREKYLEVLDQDAVNKYAHYNLGVIYQQLNATDDARAAYNQAIEIDATYAPALFNLAVLETAENPDEAIRLYRRLIELNDEDANSHFNLGLLLRDLGQTQEADAEIQRAIELNPELESRIPPPDSTPTTAAP